MATARLHFTLYYNGKRPGLNQNTVIVNIKVDFMSWCSFYFGRGALGGGTERIHSPGCLKLNYLLTLASRTLAGSGIFHVITSNSKVILHVIA